MYYEELYNQAMNGKADALEELKADASSGDAEAQYVLSCVYDNLNSPFKDISLGMYWLEKSAEYEFEPAKKKLKELPSSIKIQYGIDDNNEEKSDRESDPENIKPGGIWSFRGRIDRTTYWVYSIVYILVFGLLLFLISLIPMESTSVDYGYYPYNTMRPTLFAICIELIVRLILSYLVLALSVKRMHDCGHSGWWVLIPFCPLVLLFWKGEEKTNQYGPITE